MKKILTIFLLTAFPVLGDILLWQVDDTAKIDGTPIQNWIMASPYVEDDDHWVAARVKLSDGNGTILDIWYDNPDDPPSRWESGYWGSWIGDVGGGHWGTGINQSETGYNTIQSVQNMFDGVTPSYPPEVMEVLFAIEIGYNSWDEDLGDYVWETLAESAPELYKDMVNRYMYAQGDIAPLNSIWTPTAYTTPEPSSGILFLIGLSFLLLKRPKPFT